MIYDAENTFFWHSDLISGTTSDVVANGEGGDAYNALWLTAAVEEALDADGTLSIETDDSEGFGSAVTLAEIPLKKEAGTHVKVKLPPGGKKFYRLSVGTATTGKINAALVMDTEIG